MTPTAPEDGVGRGGAEMDGDLWSLALGSGMSRRRFMQLLAAGGAAAVLAACVGDSPQASSPTPGAADDAATAPWFKDPAPFIRRDGGLESRLQNMRGVITPNRLFFVRNHYGLAKATQGDENGFAAGGTTRASVIGAESPCRNLLGWLAGTQECRPALAVSTHGKVVR